jgi:hypothetical protein
MNCDCIRTQETRILEGFKGGKLKTPERAGAVRSTTCQGHGLNFVSGKTCLGVKFDTHFHGRKAPYTIQVLASFCPFCGKPITDSGEQTPP